MKKDFLVAFVFNMNYNYKRNEMRNKNNKLQNNNETKENVLSFSKVLSRTKQKIET